MALDPNQINDENMPLTAEHDDGYGDLAETLSLTPARKKPSIAMIAMLVALVGIGGAYAAFEFFIAGDDAPATFQKPVDLAPQMADTPTDTLTPAAEPNASLPPTVAPAQDMAPAEAMIDPNAVVPQQIAPVDPNAVPATAIAPLEAGAQPVAPAVAQAVTDPALPHDPTAIPLPPEEMAQPNPSPSMADPNVMPPPAEAQLKPIDPNQVVAKATGEVVGEVVPPVNEPAAPVTEMQKKTADTMAAVNEILGRETAPSPQPAPLDGQVAQQPVAPQPPVEVISRAEQVIKVKKNFSSQSPQAMMAAGDRVLADNQYGAAIEIYDRQLRDNPSDTMALAGKALALQKTGRETEAMDSYQRLTELNSRDVESLTNYLGLLQKQKPEEAMQHLNNLAEQYPDNAAVAGQIASVYAGQMDTPSALRYFMKARALDSRNATYPFNIAVLYDRMGNQEKAKAYYRDALNVVRDNSSQQATIPVEKILARMRSVN